MTKDEKLEYGREILAAAERHHNVVTAVGYRNARQMELDSEIWAEQDDARAALERAQAQLASVEAE